jgi:hypothetical protein
MGCIMMRKCHTNTCPVGIATQARGGPHGPRSALRMAALVQLGPLSHLQPRLLSLAPLSLRRTPCCAPSLRGSRSTSSTSCSWWLRR